MTNNETLNLCSLTLSFIIGSTGFCNLYSLHRGFTVTRVAHVLITIACFYNCVVLTSVFCGGRGFDVDGLSKQSDPAQAFIMVSLALLRVSQSVRCYIKQHFNAAGENKSEKPLS